MATNLKEIDFLQNKTYVGTFTMPNDDKTYAGKLIYEKGKTFELYIYGDVPFAVLDGL